MDADWTFSSCSWLWEDDITFKNECVDSQWACDLDNAYENNPTAPFGIIVQPNNNAAVAISKAAEDRSLQCGTMCGYGTEIQGGKRAALSGDASGISVRKYKKKLLAKSATRGMPWTDEEHRQFLYGLTIHGKGNWKAIAKDCVVTRTNEQVASHAQKHFQRLAGYKRKGKRAIITNPTSTSFDEMSSNKEKLMTGSKSDGSPNHQANLPSLALDLPYFSGISCPPSFTYPIPKTGASANAVPKRDNVSSLMLNKEYQGTSMLPQALSVNDFGAPSTWFT